MMKPASHYEVIRDTLRVPQYVKNLLLFVPLLTSHSFTLDAVLRVLLAFVLFSLCASAGYIINDIIDCESDKRHPVKSKRPFASGKVTRQTGYILVFFLLLFSFVGTLFLPPLFIAVLLLYFVTSAAYSLYLKRRLMLDIIVLAGLFTLRVIAGSVVLPVQPSEWLIAFSVMIFTCLALVKRYMELALRQDAQLGESDNRDYRVNDMNIVMALASASGLNAVTIFAFYISSYTVSEMYRSPAYLWMMCPALLYWIGRVLLLAHRRKTGDDPIQFAMNDKVSYAVLLFVGVILYLAI